MVHNFDKLGRFIRDSSGKFPGCARKIFDCLEGGSKPNAADCAGQFSRAGPQKISGEIAAHKSASLEVVLFDATGSS